MNGFQLHGMQHTSPSAINAWAESPDWWVAKYLFKRQFPTGAAMAVGIAVENVVARVLQGQDYESSLEAETGEYNKKILFMGQVDARERANHIAPMSAMALEQLKPYGEPEFGANGKQKSIKIVAKGDDWELPIIGYLDFHFPKHGLIVDLKTTGRMPSAMSPAHKRQATIYSRAMGNQAVKFLYVTPKKVSWLEDETPTDTRDEVKNILTRQERFLRLSSDPQELAKIVHVTDSFYWSGSKGIRAELFGM